MNSDSAGVMVGVFTNPLSGLFGMDGNVTTSNGVQLGLINGGNHVNGVQTGIWNMANQIGGLQLGLINSSRTGGMQFGLLNFKTDGFLPVFPLVNF